jgi:hypothetical protein
MNAAFGLGPTAPAPLAPVLIFGHGVSAGMHNSGQGMRCRGASL